MRTSTRPDRTLLALAGIALASVAIRLYDLGGRIFHWDEGRVGYWTLRYAETGVFEYSPIIHGPFLPIVNGYVFEIFGPTDAAARLVVALVGGLLPLAAWLYREHLDRAELVALALLLATTLLFVYYSRFMRNDVLVGAFSFVALGFAVRAIDARDVRRLYPAAIFGALALATKGNAVLYALCFAGAAALLLDHRLVRLRELDGSPREAALERLRSIRAELAARSGRRHPGVWVAAHAVGLGATFLAVVVFFYAPRPALWGALTDPSAWAWLLSESTIGAAGRLYDLWIAGDLQGHDYLPYLWGLLQALAYGAGAIVVLAAVGFVADGYGRAGRSRALVAFAAYWGVASAIGYPVATDIRSPWAGVHVALPLAIPAAVGLAYVARAALAALDEAREELRASESPRNVDPVADGGSPVGSISRETALKLSLTGVLLLGAVAGTVGPNALYWNSTESDHVEVVQWAQPHNDVRPTVELVERVIREYDHDAEADVLFVGTTDPASGETKLYLEDESSASARPVGGPAWHSRLPFPWYVERAGGTSASVPPDAPASEFADDAPPIVIAHHWDRGCEEPGDRCLDEHFEDYVAYEHGVRLWSLRFVFYVHEDALEAIGEAPPE